MSNKPLCQSYFIGSKNVYAGEYPGDKYGEKAETKLQQMINFGVRHFVDLTEEGEINPYAHLLPSECTHTRFPIRDVSTPKNVDDVCRLVYTIKELAKRDDGYVYIHCWGGVGRTGVIVACYLAEEMAEPSFEVVMKSLRDRFSDMPKSSHRVTPETHEQETFIARYVEGVKERRQEQTSEKISVLQNNKKKDEEESQMSDDVRQALLLWKMGAGNSAKRFNGENPIPEKREVATQKSWSNHPMPEKNVVIPMNVRISREAMQRVKYGHIPDAMEDHWFMYCDESTIRYYRSWTGICVFIAKYIEEGDSFRITELQASRNPEEYSNEDVSYDVALFMALLTEEYGGDAGKWWEIVMNS